MKFLKWIAQSFEGHDGKTSFRRLTAFILISINTFMIGFDKLPESVRDNIYYANLVTIGLIIGIVTTQNILSFFNRGGKNEQAK